MKEKKHVLVAMSGGVDSSVAAALLLEKGFNVTGIMLNLWSDPTCENQNACCTPEAQRIARAVAHQLKIPFYVIDAKSIFYREVVQYFIKNHEFGLTPNPCWVCNVQVKWKVLLDQVKLFNADFIATGHYAKLLQDKDHLFHLYTALDKKKDQSYVLSGLNQQQMAHTQFPLGDFTKSQVRVKALQLGLSTADREESQDLCFLGKKTPEEFLEEIHLNVKKEGDIVDSQGKLLGHHHGLEGYTVGQRKGIKVAAAEPYYVIEKIVSSNTLLIGHKSELGRKSFTVSNVNWISGHKPQLPLSAQVQIRYHAKKVDANLEKGVVKSLNVTSSTLLRDITPGQIAVFYNGEEVLASGIIQ